MLNGKVSSQDLGTEPIANLLDKASCTSIDWYFGDVTKYFS